MAWLDISDQLTPEGLFKLKADNTRVLKFSKNGQIHRFKIMRIAHGKCWVKPVELFDPEQVEIVDASR